MSNNLAAKKYERKITPLERLFTRSPFSLVTMVVRIKGDVSEDQLTQAVSKVQRRHTNLRVRIRDDQDHVPWFTSEGVGEIPVKAVPREADDHWIQVHQEASKVPFEFEKRPAIRFILVRAPTVSELIILCHHIICDGLSLAYLARDLMEHLGDPGREVEVLLDPLPVNSHNFPADVSLSGLVKFFINRINQKWEAEKIYFDQTDYQALNDAYWNNFHHKLFSIELSEVQTSALVDRCRKEKVTVNTALTAAFVGAQVEVQSKQHFHSSIGIAGNLRDRLPNPAGEAIGFYAGVVRPKCKYDGRKSFWENARNFHKKIRPFVYEQKPFQ